MELEISKKTLILARNSSFKIMETFYEFGCNFEIPLRQVNKLNFLNVLLKPFFISYSNVQASNAEY